MRRCCPLLPLLMFIVLLPPTPARGDVYTLGSSYTWDAVPPGLDDLPRWHIDCGRSLIYIHDNPYPCISSSTRWPFALPNTEFHHISFQPVDQGTSTLQTDLFAIGDFLRDQPAAAIVIQHTWPEPADWESVLHGPSSPNTNRSQSYGYELRDALKQAYPARSVVLTRSNEMLDRIYHDCAAQQCPLPGGFGDMFRDSAGHMSPGPGRYLQHNALRAAFGQPIGVQPTAAGTEPVSPDVKAYLDLVVAAYACPCQLYHPSPPGIAMFARVVAPGEPDGIAVAPGGGRVYVATAKASTSTTREPSVIFGYDASGALVSAWTIQGQDTSQPYGLAGIAIDGDGFVYALDRSPPRVLRFHPTTGVQRLYATLRDVAPCASGGAVGDCSAGPIDRRSLPSSLVFAPDGTLYVTDAQQALIWRVRPRRGVGEVWFTDAALAGPSGPNGIRLRGDGRTLVVAYGGSASSGSGAPAGALYDLPIQSNGSPGALSLFWQSHPGDRPAGFSLATSGFVYVALAGANQLVRIDADGHEVSRVPGSSAENQQLAVPMDTPAGTGSLGKQLLVTNQSLERGDADSWVVYDVAVGETGLPLYYPTLAKAVPGLGPLGSLLLAAALAASARVRRRRSPSH